MLKIHNDLTKKKEKFIPLNENEVSIYVCGPTVYDSPHIGHARAAIAFDILRRYLLYKGYKINFVSNYTDIDDKMINRANELGISVVELADKYIDEYEKVMNDLNVIHPDLTPLATKSIEAIQDLIKMIIDNDYGYESNGSVYFDVEKFAEKYEYDTLFQRKVEKKQDSTQSDSELDISSDFFEEKRGEKDFALWKKGKENEPMWESPWGSGRPGWHIECSAMIYKNIGKQIDIHGGGKDLLFPHHTNEIAQTKAAIGIDIAKYWVHNGFVNINNEKMSKSLKNFFSAEEVIKEYSGMILRFFLSSVNYRRPINYTIENLNEAKVNYEKLKDFYGFIKHINTSNNINEEDLNKIKKFLISKRELFLNAMDDDLNTAPALNEIYNMIKRVNLFILEEKKGISLEIKAAILDLLDDYSKIFGVILDNSQTLLMDGSSNDGLSIIIKEKEENFAKLMDIIINLRTDLRKNKQYDLADQIRDELKKIGIEMGDTKGKTFWKYISD
ncbi:MAG: cysteine--tRNA ligase [archaeon]|nr:cysteine--tRNA ligase [archaeon]